MNQERFTLQKNINEHIAKLNRKGWANTDIAKDITERFGVKFTCNHVNRRLIKWGVKSRVKYGRYCVKMKRYFTPNEVKQQDAEIVRALRAGMLTRQVSDQFNVSVSLVQTIAAKAGMDLRSAYLERIRNGLPQGPFTARYTMSGASYVVEITTPEERNDLIVDLLRAGMSVRNIAKVCRTTENKVRSLGDPHKDAREATRKREAVGPVLLCTHTSEAMRDDIKAYAAKHNINTSEAMRRLIRIGLNTKKGTQHEH